MAYHYEDAGKKTHVQYYKQLKDQFGEEDGAYLDWLYEKGLEIATNPARDWQNPALQRHIQTRQGALSKAGTNTEKAWLALFGTDSGSNILKEMYNRQRFWDETPVNRLADLVLKLYNFFHVEASLGSKSGYANVRARVEQQANTMQSLIAPYEAKEFQATRRVLNGEWLTSTSDGTSVINLELVEEMLDEVLTVYYDIKPVDNPEIEQAKENVKAAERRLAAAESALASAKENVTATAKALEKTRRHDISRDAAMALLTGDAATPIRDLRNIPRYLLERIVKDTGNARAQQYLTIRNVKARQKPLASKQDYKRYARKFIADNSDADLVAKFTASLSRYGIDPSTLGRDIESVVRKWKKWLPAFFSKYPDGDILVDADVANAFIQLPSVEIWEHFHTSVLGDGSEPESELKRLRTADKIACSVCAAPTQLACNGCKTSFYCGQACQDIGWKQGHQRVCLFRPPKQ